MGRLKNVPIMHGSHPYLDTTVKFVPDDGIKRVYFESVPIEDVSKQQLDPRHVNMTNVMETGVVIDPSNSQKVFNPSDPAYFDAEAERQFAAAEAAADNVDVSDNE